MTVINLATNPSFETTSGTVEVRRNLVTNGVPATTTGWSGSSSVVTTFSDGRPAFQTTADGASVPYTFSNPSATAIVTGQTYVLSALIEASAGVEAIDIRAHQRTSNVYFASGGLIGYDPTGKGVHRVSIVFTAPNDVPAGDFDFSFVYYATGSSLLPAGEWLRVGQLIIEKASVVGSYFDGSTAAAGDFTYAWTGTANASASIQRGAALPSPSSGQASVSIQSSAWFSAGAKSLRNIPKTSASATLPGGTGLTFGMVAGGTYTALVKLRLTTAQSGTLSDYARRVAVFNVGTLISRTDQAPNVAGVHELRLTFTVPVDATSAYLTLYNGSPETDAWWDDLMVIEGTHTGPYFDGDTPTVAAARYAWTGAPHASTSTYTFRGVTVDGITSAPCPRAGVTVEGLSPGDHQITVWRTADGERAPVRGMRTITVVDSVYQEDYEVPLGRLVRYELEILSGPDAGLQGLRADAQVDSTSGWIQDPLNPASAVPVSASLEQDETVLLAGTFAEVAYRAETSRFNVMGSSRPVAIAGRRSAPSGIPFSMLTLAEAENVRLRDLVRESPLLVIRGLPSWGTRVPGAATYAADTVTERNTLPGDEMTVWETTGDIVRPSSARVVIALWTYQDVAQIFATYDQKQSAATGLTYLEDQKNPANV